ncbi:heparanase-like isoform X2 [Haliotis rufescens]|uniref:heparanase-like isoform X2 n=1 Tax=Haliotis rufescens TaxID=6454 RepID=UPI00201E79F3|nr:heparanase-like isoform X2 [Haliotis rufescens]
MDACHISLLCIVLTYVIHAIFATEVNVDFNRVLQVIDDKFVAVTLDSHLIQEGWQKFDFGSEKLVNLAHGLAPCYLRLGGTAADLLTFDPQKTAPNKPWSAQQYQEFLLKKHYKNFTMSATDWDLINKFSAAVGWELIFDLNVLIRDQGSWDPTNAMLLMNYTKSRGYKLAGFELGNEPNAFHHVFGRTVTAADLARDFVRLRQIMGSYSQSTLLVGPDVTKVDKKNVRLYFEEFLASGGGKVVDKATFHHYYVDGRTADVGDFIDASILDSLKTDLTDAITTAQAHAPGVPVWIGETASAYGGGAEGLSDAYVAGFMWLDKLGLSALYGVKGVFRQSFYKGNYALLDLDTLDPNPDYWLTLLYKRLVGRQVFHVTTTSSSDRLRIYAHCTSTNSTFGYKPGSLTVYAMNIDSSNTTLSLPQFQDRTLHVYWLTPGGGGGLKSKFVNLNNKTLELVDKQLPSLTPSHSSASTLSIPAHSFGFLVIPDANILACQK